MKSALFLSVMKSRGLCELYGFEPFDLANEGTFLIAMPEAEAIKALRIMHTFDSEAPAAIIGRVSEERMGEGGSENPLGVAVVI